MIKVYFEKNGHAEIVALFESEDIYITCLPILTLLADENGSVVTESIDKSTIFESKESVIAEYLQNQQSEKEVKRNEKNKEYYKKYNSDPEKKKRRAELDRIRYEKNKAIGNQK